MPNYEFECKRCDARFTLQESFKEHNRHQEKCPKCGSKRVQQLMSSVHVKTSKKS